MAESLISGVVNPDLPYHPEWEQVLEALRRDTGGLPDCAAASLGFKQLWQPQQAMDTRLRLNLMPGYSRCCVSRGHFF